MLEIAFMKANPKIWHTARVVSARVGVMVGGENCNAVYATQQATLAEAVDDERNAEYELQELKKQLPEAEKNLDEKTQARINEQKMMAAFVGASNDPIINLGNSMLNLTSTNQALNRILKNLADKNFPQAARICEPIQRYSDGNEKPEPGALVIRGITGKNVVTSVTLPCSAEALLDNEVVKANFASRERVIVRGIKVDWITKKVLEDPFLVIV